MNNEKAKQTSQPYPIKDTGVLMCPIIKNQ